MNYHQMQRYTNYSMFKSNIHITVITICNYLFHFELTNYTSNFINIIPSIIEIRIMFAIIILKVINSTYQRQGILI